MLDRALRKLPPVVWAGGTIWKLPRFEKAAPQRQSVLLLLLLLLPVDLISFGPAETRMILSNGKVVLITRDIPTLTATSPPRHQLGLPSPPLRQIVWFQRSPQYSFCASAQLHRARIVFEICSKAC